MSATPPEFVILWPIIRRPLSGHIVRQPNGNLAEWFPLPSEWPAPPSSGERPKEILQFQEATDSNPGWILLEHRDEPTFAKASTLANQPGEKLRFLRGFATFIQSKIDNNPIVLYPELLFCPGWGITLGDGLPFEAWSYPSSKDWKETWSDFFAAWDLNSWEDEKPNVHFLMELLSQKNDPNGAVKFLLHWVAKLEKAQCLKKRQTKLFWIMALVIIGLILGWAITGRFALQHYQILTKARNELNQAELLGREQAQGVVLLGRQMALGLPRLGAKLTVRERKGWQDWLNIAATFAGQESSHGELNHLCAKAHLLLGQSDQAEQIWRRLAGGTGPYAAIACLAIATSLDGLDGERKQWLDRSDSVLDSEEDSPFADFVRVQIGFAQEAFCRSHQALPEAEKLKNDSLNLLWELIESRANGPHSYLLAKAVPLLLEHLPISDLVLAKVGILLETALEQSPGSYDLHFARIFRLVGLQQVAKTRDDRLAAGLAHFRAIVLKAGQFPERLENRVGEILGALDLADEASLLFGEGTPSTQTEDIWIWAQGNVQSLLIDAPRDGMNLRLLGRAWITGSRTAECAPQSNGLVRERLKKGLAVWNLLERLEGPSEDLRLVRAQTLVEQGWLDGRMGDGQSAREINAECQMILSKLLGDNPGSVAAQSTLVHLKWRQALLELSQKESQKAKKTVQGLVTKVASFPKSRDPADLRQVSLLLIQARFLDFCVRLRGFSAKDQETLHKELALLKTALNGVPKESDTQEELLRLLARLAWMEVALGPQPKAKPQSTPLVLKETAQKQTSLASWEPWERNHLETIWNPGN